MLGLDFYIAYAIMTGNAKWEDVQDPWKPAVKRWLDAYGFGTDGKPLPKNA